MSARKPCRNADLEWFLSAVLAATGITVFGHFEKTPRWRRLSKWALYFGGTALLSRGPGRPWTYAWVLGLPGAGSRFHLWWRLHEASVCPRALASQVGHDDVRALSFEHGGCGGS
jgi:hypothetical protein